MNPIEEFYRKKEILKNIRKWTNPLNVNVNEDRETMEIGFHSDISTKITKAEKINLLKIMMVNMEDDLRNVVVSNGNPKVLLIEKLKDELEELKEKIKKDLDLDKEEER